MTVTTESKLKAVIIAGGRDFNDSDLLARSLTQYEEETGNTIETVITGMALGADLLGRKWAREQERNVIELPAQWNLYGRSAGFMRNGQMAKIADELIAFWDGKSRGTHDMIKKMETRNKPVLVVPY